MLWGVVCVLIFLWMLGLLGHVGGPLIHLLLIVVVVVVVLVQFLGGGRN